MAHPTLLAFRAFLVSPHPCRIDELLRFRDEKCDPPNRICSLERPRRGADSSAPPPCCTLDEDGVLRIRSSARLFLRRRLEMFTSGATSGVERDSQAR